MKLPDMTSKAPAVFFAGLGLFVTGFSGRILEMINASPEFYVIYGMSPAASMLLMALLLVVLPVTLGVICWAFARSKRFGAVALLLLFVLLAVVLSGAIRGMNDPTGGWLLMAGSAVVAAMGAYAFVKLDVVRFALAATALYLPILMFQSLVATGVGLPSILGNEAQSASGQAEAGSQPNVLLVVFDEFPITSILGQDGLIDPARFPNLRALADGSDWFRQASSVSCNTSTAVPAIESGKLFGSPPTSLPPLVQFYSRNVFTLLGKSYRVDATETITQLCPDYLCGKRENKKPFPYRPFMEHLGVAWLHASFPHQMEKDWPDLDTYWMNAAATRDKPPALKNDRYQVRFGQIARFTKSLGHAPRPWLKFAHFLMPHSPFQSTGDGALYYWGKTTWGIDGKVWSNQAEHVYQSYARHIEQVRYTDGIIGELVAKLRSIGQYDNTLIAIVADHGVSFIPGDARRRTDDKNFPNLIGVPMFIKEPGQKVGKVIDEAVQTVDMLPTILGLIGLDAGKADFDGRDVLAPEHEPISERLHYCNHKDYLRFPVDLLPHLIDKVRVRDELFGTRPDGEMEFLFAPRSEWLGQSITSLGTVQQSSAVAVVGGLTDHTPPINLDGTLQGVADVEEIYVVATMNGKVASVMPLVEDGKENNIVSSFLLPRLIPDGAESVELYITRKAVNSPPVFEKLRIVDQERNKTVDQLTFDPSSPSG